MTPAAPAARPGARPARWPMLAAVALIFAGDFELRRRDVGEALGGSVDVFILFELAVFGAVFGWMFFVVARPPRRRDHAPELLATWVLVGLLAVSALWASSPTLAVARSIQLLVTMAFAHVLARRGGRTQFHLIGHAYVVLITLGVLVGAVFRRPPDRVADRFAWAYTHPVVAGSLLALSLTLLVAWTFDRRALRSFPDIVYPLLLVLHAGALLATQTRGSILGYLTGLLVFVWLSASRSRRAGVVLIGLLALPLAVVGLGSAVTQVLTRGESVEALRNLNSRLDLWDLAVDALSGRWLLGRGYFSSREIFLDDIGLGGSHNAYIEVLVSVGLLGTIVFVVVLGLLIRRLHLARAHPDRALVAALLTVLLVNGVSAQYLAQAGTGANVWFLLVVAWCASMRGTPVPRRRPPTARPLATPSVIDLTDDRVPTP